jgi:hypothetical protein
MGTKVSCIHVNESVAAFNINGVTFAKKYLRELFPSWGDSDNSFYRYLVMVPFLAETKEPEDTPTPIGFYAVAKAKRIQKALDVYGDDIVGFMMMAAHLGNIDPDNFGAIADQCHDNICNCGKKKSPQVVDLRVLH